MNFFLGQENSGKNRKNVKTKNTGFKTFVAISLLFYGNCNAKHAWDMNNVKYNNA